MYSRFKLAISSLCLTIATIIPTLASNSGARLLAVLGDNFNAIRAVPYISSRPRELTPSHVPALQDKGLIRGVVKSEGYDTKQLLVSTKNLMLVRLQGPVFRPGNTLFLSALSAWFRREANCYLSDTITKAYGMSLVETKKKKQKARTLPNIVESLRYESPYKTVFLVDSIPDETLSLLFTKRMQELQIPGFFLLAEVEPQQEALPIIAAYRNGELVLDGTYTLGNAGRPGNMPFISQYMRLLFENKSLPISLPNIEHVFSKKGDVDFFRNPMVPGTYIRSLFTADGFSGVIYPDVESTPRMTFNVWAYRTKWPNGTFSEFSYPRFEEGSVHKKV